MVPAKKKSITKEKPRKDSGTSDNSKLTTGTKANHDPLNVTSNIPGQGNVGDLALLSDGVGGGDDAKQNGKSEHDTTEVNEAGDAFDNPEVEECDTDDEDCWELETDARYYVSNSGDIINEDGLSEPESMAMSDTIILDEELDELPDGPNYFRDLWEIDPSDIEEENEVTKKYFEPFKVVEPEVTEGDVPFLGELDGEDAFTNHWENIIDMTLKMNEIRGIPNSKIRRVDFSNQQLRNATSVEHLTNLSYLNISTNFIRNLKCLGRLEQLLQLDASGNELVRFLDIYTREIHPLREANFSKNQISEIVTFNRFTNLTFINLSHNRLKVIHSFNHCYNLRYLNLADNNISEIQNLGCRNLIVLLMQRNKISDLSELRKCHEIRHLNISRNQIRDLTVLTKMPRLVELRCTHNLIGIEELTVLQSLPNLSYLRLTPNPVTEIGMSRSMLIFTLPQLRYLDKAVILPEEIIEAQNIFKPPFEKIAFEDHRITSLEKTKQSAHMMFREYLEMYPIPRSLILVGPPKSRAEILGSHLKDIFHHQIYLGGIHSTATTIECGNHPSDIPISTENFLKMKSRGEIFSTSSILGRLCGLSGSQFIRAVEHEAILVCTNIPLETAIALRKWGFKPKFLLVVPTDPPHFNVDQFIVKQQKSLESGEQPQSEELHENRERLISFGSAGNLTDEKSKPNDGKKSILHHASRDEADSVVPIDVSVPLDGSGDTVEGGIESKPGGKAETRSHITPPPSPAESEETMGEWMGENETIPVACQQDRWKPKADPDQSLDLSGIEIINPSSIPGIDWKQTILRSDFYEAILSMDDELHFLVVLNLADPSNPFSYQYLHDALQTIRYDLAYGPTLVYMQPNCEFELTDGESLVEIRFQLIVVRETLDKTSFPSCTAREFVTQRTDDICGEDGGEGDAEAIFANEARDVYPEDEIYGEEFIPNVDEDKNKAEGEVGKGSNKFRHRDALEFSILHARSEYVQFHLDNPGFFSCVLDTADLDTCKDTVEQIVKDMLMEFKGKQDMKKKTGVDYPLVESYTDLVSDARASEAFYENTMNRIRIQSEEKQLGLSPGSLVTAGHSLSQTIFSRPLCSNDLLTPTFPKQNLDGLLAQFEKSAIFRKKRDASLIETQSNPRQGRCTLTGTCDKLLVDSCSRLKNECPQNQEFLGEIDYKICPCGDDVCPCHPLDPFSSDSFLSHHDGNQETLPLEKENDNADIIKVMDHVLI